MKQHTTLLSILILLLILLPGCRATTPDAEPTLASPTSVPANDPLPVLRQGEEDAALPAAITRAFYDWYTTEGNFDLLLDSEYARYLTPRLRTVLAEHDGNFDPILLAQDWLQEFEVLPWFRHEGEAGVLVQFGGDNRTPHDLSVYLKPADGELRWQIDRISRGNLSTPEGVVGRFYENYLGYYHAEGDPLADGHYREMEALGEGLVMEIEEQLDAGAGHDPLWMAEALPQRFRVDDATVSGDRATAVMLLWWQGESTPTPLTVHLARAGASWVMTGVEAPAVVSAPELPPPPEAVVDRFFADYLAAGGFATGAHRANADLNPVFVAELAEQERVWEQAGIPADGYDPILQGIIPGDDPGAVRVSAGPPAIAFDRAELQAWREWPGVEGALPLNVSLQRAPAGQWQIVGVSSVASPPEQIRTTTPEAALAARQADPAADPARLVEGVYTAALAYRDAPAHARAVGNQLALPVAAPEAITFCAQTFPLGISVDGSFIQGESASVVVQTTLDRHLFTVELAPTAGGWTVTGVTCGDSPAGRARAFYTWYLGNSGGASSYRLQNPFRAGSYGDTPFLTPAFVAEVNGLRAEGGRDPFLYARVAPDRFAVEAGPAAEQATVHFYFGEQTQTVVVTAVEQQGRWLIAGTELAGAADLAPPPAEVTVDTGEWQSYADAVYPFSFRVPAGWEVVAEEARVMDPQRDRRTRAVRLYSAELAAARAAGADATESGWPAGLPVFTVEVVEGDAQALAATYPLQVATSEAAYNGYPVLVQQESEAYPAYRYIFEHPEYDLWVIFLDYLSDFPGREAYAAEVEGILPGILSTFSFEGG